jgi:hypothetical protein
MHGIDVKKKKGRLINGIKLNTQNSYTYGHLVFDKEAKNHTTEKKKKKSIFNKWCWSNWMLTCRKMQIDP